MKTRQDHKQIDKWLDEEFPGVMKRAETENAEIFFSEETNIQNTSNYTKDMHLREKLLF